MGDVTSYVGQDYPVMAYGCSQSVSGSDVQIAALIAEKTALEGVFTDLMTPLTTAINAKRAHMSSSVGTYSTYHIGDMITDGLSSGVVSASSASTAFYPYGNYGVDNGSEWDILMTVTYVVSASTSPPSGAI
jgi:hypothetical protein